MPRYTRAESALINCAFEGPPNWSCNAIATAVFPAAVGPMTTATDATVEAITVLAKTSGRVHPGYAAHRLDARDYIILRSLLSPYRAVKHSFQVRLVAD